MFTLRHLAVIAVLLVSVPTAWAQSIWYVDVNGTAPGTGTPDDPYVSIQYAIDQPSTVTGDRLFVAAGTYRESVDFKNKGLSVRSTAGPLHTIIAPEAPTSFGSVVELPRNIYPAGRLTGFTILGLVSPGQSDVGVRSGSGVLSHCIVTGMMGGRYPAGAVVCEFNLWMEKCTVVGNNHGITVNPNLGLFFVDSSIIAFNAGIDLEPTGAFIIDFSCWETGVGPGFGMRNFVGDPLLWNPSQGDYRLGPSSPCIDAGDPELPKDPDGSRADMGALSFDPAYLPPIETYCTAKTNSQGCAASIEWRGEAGASASWPIPFLVTASNVVDGSAGLLFYGFERQALPFQGAFHCVKPPIVRAPPQLSSPTGAACSGSFSFDLNGYIQAGFDLRLVPGVVLDAQWWYRDPMDLTGFGTGLSNAIELAVGP